MNVDTFTAYKEEKKIQLNALVARKPGFASRGDAIAFVKKELGIKERRAIIPLNLGRNGNYARFQCENLNCQFRVKIKGSTCKGVKTFGFCTEESNLVHLVVHNTVDGEFLYTTNCDSTFKAKKVPCSIVLCMAYVF